MSQYNHNNTDRLYETEQRLLVPLPLRVKLALRWELVAAELHGDLQTVGVQVVEVRHTWEGHRCVDDERPEEQRDGSGHYE